MTVKGLYEWAVENECEDFLIINDSHSGNCLTADDIYVDETNKHIHI